MNASKHDSERGFTLIEILAVVATLALLVALLLPSLSKSTRKSERIYCVNNLKQIDLSFRIWPADSSDKFPMARSTNQGGTMEYISTGEVFRHFQTLSNELGSPLILICPADRERAPASSFLRLANSNISYFLGVDAHENLPQSILAGDRNITNGFTPKNGMLELTTNQSVGWTKAIHKFQGNVALGDGSVQQVSNEQLQKEILVNSDFATNRIALP